jgi:hypothetical protein
LIVAGAGKHDRRFKLKPLAVARDEADDGMNFRAPGDAGLALDPSPESEIVIAMTERRMLSSSPSSGLARRVAT